MRNLSIALFSCGLALLSVSPLAMAQSRQTFTVKKAIPEQSADTRVEDLDEMSFVEMINSVPLDDKSAALIRKFQEKEGRNRLLNREFGPKSKCTVETYRNKEVLLLSIPASSLFAPNDTVLRKDAASLLAPLKRYMKNDDMYRVLLVMHTDNTGSEEYRDMLTEERSRAVADWFADHGADTTYLFPYAFGDDMPLKENNSIENRAANRRLEVYLMPGKKMLEQAKKGRIVF
ncbi:MAG: OmpA family protein [Candidatus Amulumruptor caecigallinarius]|nr:OmpA family protein [Candidatus Amulumruptor caecigallinarius]